MVKNVNCTAGADETPRSARLMRDDRFHILMVDDNPDDRMLIRRALVREFRSRDHRGRRSQELATPRRGPFDLVITDYGLGFTDGFASSTGSRPSGGVPGHPLPGT